MTRSKLVINAVTVAAAMTVVAVAGGPPPATATTSSTMSATAAPDDTTRAGTFVFIGVCVVIALGAAGLVLATRRRRTTPASTDANDGPTVGR